MSKRNVNKPSKVTLSRFMLAKHLYAQCHSLRTNDVGGMPVGKMSRDQTHRHQHHLGICGILFLDMVASLRSSIEMNFIIKKDISINFDFGNLNYESDFKNGLAAEKEVLISSLDNEVFKKKSRYQVT